MGRTVGHNGYSGGFVAAPSDLASTLTWIHADSEPQQLLETVRQVAKDGALGNPPLVENFFSGQQRVAAAYFRILPGRVGTLGGVRVEPGYEAACCSLIGHLTRKLKAQGVRQVQAIVDPHDSARERLMLQGGFEPLTRVQQLWLGIDRVPTASTPSGFEWLAASRLPRPQLVELLDTTFVDTLDCPLLNNVRDSADVLLGFLEGQSLDDELPWFLLTENGLALGCVFLSQHSAEVVELIYMGLQPQARGRQLGAVLLQKAISVAQQRGATVLVAAVDEQNWPALQTYRRHQFEPVRTLNVLVPESDLEKMRRVA